METWDLASLDVLPHAPRVLASGEETRLIAIDLPAGQELGEHQTHERGFVLVIEGEVEVAQGERSERGGRGFLAAFPPNERREVRATQDARILLVLAPWPGVGHPSRRGAEPSDAAA
jgi:quercetin dioxygenase-like cupin family protein